MLFHPMLTPANKRTDRRWSCVENVDSILFDDFPESIGFRPVRRTFIHNNRGAVRERTIDDVTVTGHSYIVYGPLANGAPVVMYEGAPNWPEPDRFWKIIEEYRVNILYTAPTAIRAFIRWGDEWVAK